MSAKEWLVLGQGRGGEKGERGIASATLPAHTVQGGRTASSRPPRGGRAVLCADARVLPRPRPLSVPELRLREARENVSACAILPTAEARACMVVV